MVEGAGAPISTVRCSWEPGEANVDSADISVQLGTSPRGPLSALGWADAAKAYRPFLSHNELGQVLIKEPKVMFDALSEILGLGDLTAAVARLKAKASALKAAVSASKAQAQGLLRELNELDDPRAPGLAKHLGDRVWNLELIRGLTSGTAMHDDAQQTLLNQVTYLSLPGEDQISTAIQNLRTSLAHRQVVAESHHDLAVADLLQRALEWHQQCGNLPCPVCGSGTLTEDWANEAAAKVQAIRNATREERAAQDALDSAVGTCESLLPPTPDLLSEAPIESASTLTTIWAHAAKLPAPEDLADHLELWLPEVRAVLATCVAEAREEIDRRESRWLPVAARVFDWADQAQALEDEARTRRQVESAAAWLAEAEDRIRNARLRPIAKRAAEHWAELRQESNVELGGITLAGANTRRRVELDVRVDGSEASALAVMSQGELNALALSIFLPRATVSESPFRFLIIDDPVQAMDPSKVDGLARVLHAVASTRQVVVFTHDARLPEALRRLQLDCTVLQVSRHQESAMEISVVLSPVRRYWADADALLRDSDVVDDVAERVVPGVLRLALESACHQRIRQQRLSRPNASHVAVEELLRGKKLYPLMALALFDDEARTGDVLKRLNSWGSWAGNTFLGLNKGAHSGIARTQLTTYLRDTRDLIKKLDQWGEG